MRIIEYLNPTGKRCMDVQTVTENYDCKCEEHDVNQESSTHAQINHDQCPQSSSCIEINGEPLANTTGKNREKHLLEENLVGSADNEPQSVQDIDEEREAMLIKTTRFF